MKESEEKKVIEDRDGWTRKEKKDFMEKSEWEREGKIYKIKTIIGKRKKIRRKRERKMVHDGIKKKMK